MDDLIAWLRAHLDDDEALARACRGESWIIQGDFVFGAESADQIWFGGTHPSYPEIGEHIACHDPARVLAEVEAKRRLLDALEAPVTAENVAEEDGLILAVQIIASAYADRPGYREEWRP